MCYFLTMHVIFYFHTSLCIVTFRADAFTVSTCLNACCIRFHLCLTPSQREFTITVSGCESSCFTTQSIYTSTPSNEVTEMPSGRMRILKLPTSWLISLGIGTQYAIMCPPTLSGPSGDTENLTTVSSIYTTHAASPTMTNEFISIFTPRSGSGKVNPVKRKTV